MLSERKLINEMLNDEDVKGFIDQEKITQEEFDKYLVIFLSYYINKKKCAKCNGNCMQERTFLKPVLAKDGMYIDIDYVDCPYKMNDYLANISFLSTSFKESAIPDLAKERVEVMGWIKNFLNHVDTATQGLYLYGKYGTGKTYIMQYLALELAKENKKIAFVYYPDFSRKIRSMIATGGLEDVVEDLKKVDFLFIDDLGGDVNSSFVRDEILLSILQYRMENKMPLFATSNLKFEELREHFASKDNDIIKASRVIERIRSLTVPIELKGENRR